MKDTLNMADVQKSFDRTDKLTAFKKELTSLINYHGIDSLLNVPDHLLAVFAVGQMEVCSSVTSLANGKTGAAVLIC